MNRSHKENQEAWILEVKVTPRASSNEIIGWENGLLKIKLRAIPEKGEANLALISLLSQAVDHPKTKIILKSGQTSRKKRILLFDISKEEFQKRLIKFGIKILEFDGF